MKRKLIAAGAAVGALGAAGAGAALAFGGGDDGDNGLTGREANRAAAAALSATGGGTVNAAERDAEDGATYEWKSKGRTARPSTSGSTPAIGSSSSSRTRSSRTPGTDVPRPIGTCER